MQWHATENTRIMPWKEEKDPYKIWLSEVILQQTRVNQGLAYYKKFVENYPTIGQLASAPEQEIFKMWEGLGYYSRCRNMIITAKDICSNYNEIFPGDYKSVLALKGIGEYTAAAICSFAFNLPYAVVDGNVCRVLSRYFGIAEPVDTTSGKKIIRQMANKMLDKASPGLYNQAIMDFGAIICKPRLPACNDCFLKSGCNAYHTDTVELLPVKSKKIVKRERWFYYIQFAAGNKLLIFKRSKKDIWQDLHEYVLEEKIKLIRQEKKILQLPFGYTHAENIISLTLSPAYRQVLTHQTIYSRILHCEVKKLPGIAGGIVTTKKALDSFAFPRLLQHYNDGHNA